MTDPTLTQDIQSLRREIAELNLTILKLTRDMHLSFFRMHLAFFFLFVIILVEKFT